MRVHKLKSKKKGLNKKYGALSIVNQIIPRLGERMNELFPGHVYKTKGYETKPFRETYDLPKEHEIDAYCIAISRYGDDLPEITSEFPAVYEIKQYRRHDRARIHSQRDRVYKVDGKTVAKNRHKRTSQTDSGKWKKQTFDSLEEWYRKQVSLYGETEAEKRRSQLKAEKSIRRYNDPNRILPGAVFLFEGEYYVKKKQITNGKYFRAEGVDEKNFPAPQCKVTTRNVGLVYL